MDIEIELQEAAEHLRSEIEVFNKTRGEFEARLHHLEQHADEYRPTNRRMAGPGSAVQFVDHMEKSAAFQHIRERNAGTCRATLDLSIKGLVHVGTGTSDDTTIPVLVGNRESPVEEVLRPLTLLDVLPSRPTNVDQINFVQMTSTGDAAEQESEGGEKAEIITEGLPATAFVATIAGHSTVSRQVLDSRDRLQQAFDSLLRHKVMARLEHQIINGPGGQGKIDGFLNQGAPFTPTIATTPADIIGESLTRQADAGYVPNLVVLNPWDWFRLTIQKTLQEEEYLFGSPTNPLPPALWNVRVVNTPSVPEGTALTVDVSFTTVLDRMQPAIMVSTSHKDYFTRNLALILGELRAGLEVLDPLAIHVVSLAASSV